MYHKPILGSISESQLPFISFLTVAHSGSIVTKRTSTWSILFCRKVTRKHQVTGQFMSYIYIIRSKCALRVLFQSFCFTSYTSSQPKRHIVSCCIVIASCVVPEMFSRYIAWGLFCVFQAAVPWQFRDWRNLQDLLGAGHPGQEGLAGRYILIQYSLVYRLRTEWITSDKWGNAWK